MFNTNNEIKHNPGESDLDIGSEDDDYSSSKEHSAKQYKIKDVADMQRLSPLHLHIAYGLFLSNKNFQLYQKTSYQRAYSYIQSELSSDKKYFYYFINDISQSSVSDRKHPITNIYLSQPITFGLNNEDELKSALEICKHLNKKGVGSNEKNLFIIPIGEEIYSGGERRCAGHFITLVIIYDGNSYKSCIYDSKQDPKENILAALWYTISSYVTKINLNDPIRTIIQSKLGNTAILNREYTGTQSLLDHNSCGYQTFKMIQVILNGGDPLEKIMAPSLAECQEIYDTHNKGGTFPVLPFRVPQNEESILTDNSAIQSIDVQQLEVDDNYFSTINSTFEKKFKALLDNLVNTTLKQFKCDDFIQRNVPPIKEYKKEDYPSGAQWSDFFDEGCCYSDKRERHQVCIDLCSRLNELNYEQPPGLVNFKMFIDHSFGIYFAFSSYQHQSKSIDENVVSNNDDFKEPIRLMKETANKYCKELANLLFKLAEIMPDSSDNTSRELVKMAKHYQKKDVTVDKEHSHFGILTRYESADDTIITRNGMNTVEHNFGQVSISEAPGLMQQMMDKTAELNKRLEEYKRELLIKDNKLKDNMLLCDQLHKEKNQLQAELKAQTEKLEIKTNELAVMTAAKDARPDITILQFDQLQAEKNQLQAELKAQTEKLEIKTNELAVMIAAKDARPDITIRQFDQLQAEKNQLQAGQEQANFLLLQYQAVLTRHPQELTQNARKNIIMAANNNR